MNTVPHKLKSILIFIVSRLLLLNISLLIALLIAEVLIRSFVNVPSFDRARGKKWAVKTYSHELTPYNMKLRYKPTPNASMFSEKVINKFNSGGFRDREFPVEKQKGIKRIVFLGDSVVYGHAVQLKDSLPKQLDQIYQSEKKSVEVLNMGVSGYDTEQEIEFLKEVGLKYKPDLVIIGYCLNDATYASFEMDWFHARRNATVTEDLGFYRSALLFFYQHSKLLNFLDKKFHLQYKYKFMRPNKSLWNFVVDRNLMNRDAPDSPYVQLKEKILDDARRLETTKQSLDYILNSTGFGNSEMGVPRWNVMKKAFTQLKHLSEEHQFKVIVVIFPFLQEMERYPMDSLHAFLRSELAEIGLPVIDMLDWGKDIHARYARPEISTDAIHFTPFSAKLAAQYLYEKFSNSEYI